jgi:hypothetical protein
VRGPGFEPGNSGFEADTVASYVSRADWCGRRESNPKKAWGLNPAASPCATPAEMARPRGVEPPLARFGAEPPVPLASAW